MLPLCNITQIVSSGFLHVPALDVLNHRSQKAPAVIAPELGQRVDDLGGEKHILVLEK